MDMIVWRGVRVAILLSLIGGIVGVASADANQRHRTITGDVRLVHSFRSSILGNDRDLVVYLPPNYDREPRRRYPVLYMCDGQNLFNLETSFLPDQEWRVDESAESLIGAGLIEPLIVVGVNNAGADRGNEYLATKVRGMGGRADQYGRFLVEELKPYVDRTYRTKTQAKDTGLAGSSLGGWISMYLGVKYPQVFGKLGVISPSVWWDDRVLLKYVDEIEAKPRQRIWLDIGTAEGEGAEPDAEMLRNHLLKKGWQIGKDLAYFRDFDAHHNELAWAHRMPSILMFLFPRR